MSTALSSVLIVEPDDYRRQLHRLELLKDGGFAVTCAAATKREALVFLSRNAVDFIVTNSMLADGSPADIIRAAKRRNAEVLTLAVSASLDANIVAHTIASGADGYLLFADSTAKLASSLRVLKAGGSPASPAVSRTVVRSLQIRTMQSAQSATANPLSPRETDILRLLAKGLSFDEISQILALSRSTISTHAKNIYRKLDAHSRNEALYKARELKLL